MLRTLGGAALIADGISHHRPLETIAGSMIMMSGVSSNHSSRTQRHVVHHHHYETPQEADARYAREQRHREEYIRQEEERRMAEEKHAESEREQERQRLEIINTHLAVISHAEELRPDELYNQILALKPLQKSNSLPEIKTENLYNIVLRHKTLTSQQKIDLMNSLIQCNYSSSLLLELPLLTDLLRQDRGFDQAIYTLYFNYVQNHSRVMDHEHLLWQRLAIAKQNFAEKIFSYLLPYRDGPTMIRFTTIWMNGLESANEIMTATRHIKKLIKDNELGNYTYIEKIAKQRILNLELATLAPEVEGTPSNELKPNQNRDISTFLNTHRSVISCCCCNTKSQKIYNMIRDKKNQEAKQAIDAEQRKFDKEIEWRFS